MVGLSCLSRQNRPEWLLVQHIDYGPTFVDLAGGKVPAGLHGRSFAPILRGQTPADWRKSIYYHYYDGGHGVAKHYGLRTEKLPWRASTRPTSGNSSTTRRIRTNFAASLPILPTPMR